MSDIIIGRNACLEAIRAGRKIKTLTVLKTRDEHPGKGRKAEERSLQEIISAAQDMGAQVTYAGRAELDRMARGAVHQGVIARATEYSYSSIEEVIAFAKEKGESPFLVLLDGIEDPHNLGAIIRTAECAGAHGVVFPKNRAAAVNETVLKTSAGAAEYMRCVQVTNMVRTIEALQKEGIWVYACDMGECEIWDTDLKGPTAIVIGNEGKGVSRLVRERSDGIISLPLKGRIGSLNASNAAAVAMYEVVRQRKDS